MISSCSPCHLRARKLTASSKEPLKPLPGLIEWNIAREFFSLICLFGYWRVRRGGALRNPSLLENRPYYSGLQEGLHWWLHQFKTNLASLHHLRALFQLHCLSPYHSGVRLWLAISRAKTLPSRCQRHPGTYRAAGVGHLRGQTEEKIPHYLLFGTFQRFPLSLPWFFPPALWKDFQFQLTSPSFLPNLTTPFSVTSFLRFAVCFILRNGDWILATLIIIIQIFW